MENLTRQFVEYVSEVAGQSAAWGISLSAQLPQYLIQRYTLFEIAIGRRWFLGVVLEDNSDFKPSVFEKDIRKIMPHAPKVEGYCLIARDLPGYVRQRLVQRRIPFVVPGHQLYWPDLGLAVQARKAKSTPVPVDTISPATQVILICFLTGGIPGSVTPKILAEKLNYAPMSMSRALDEIEANKLGHVGRRGRERLLSFTESRHTLWQNALSFMRNPVRETVRIRKSLLPTSLRIDAGESALASLSMLVHPQEPIYALGRKDWKRIAGEIQAIPVEDEGTCRVQRWRYDPALFSNEGKVDIFSLYLSMREDDDERIESALEEMMENVVWS